MVTSMSVKPDPARQFAAWSCGWARARLLQCSRLSALGGTCINYAANPRQAIRAYRHCPVAVTNGNSPLAYRRVAAIGHEGLAVPFSGGDGR